MTPAEVASAIGYGPSPRELIRRIPDRYLFRPVAWEPTSAASFDKMEAWADESIVIGVCYCDGKVILKEMDVPVPRWKAKAQEWLRWLRHRVRW
jgi:hypothetical protein